MRKIIKIAAIALFAVAAGFISLLYAGIIWRSADYYPTTKTRNFAVPVMDVAAYDSVANKSRPYIFEIAHGDGVAYILGIEHTNDENNGQINIIRATWETVSPDIAFVEGHLGFLFEGFQDPVAKYGEGGATVSLAKRDDVPYFTWETKQADELKLLLQKFSSKQVAAFYALQNYSTTRSHNADDAEDAMSASISTTNDIDGIREAITDVSQIDSIWRTDFPAAKNWREIRRKSDWPKGWLKAIAQYADTLRDAHLCNVILDEIEKGKKVFVTMNSGNAFRIEKTLRNELKPNSELHARIGAVNRFRPDKRIRRRMKIHAF